MATRIIITECTNFQRKKCWIFTVKSSGNQIAEVDRVNGGYKVFLVDNGFYVPVAIRTGKESALRFARKTITGLIPDAEFKWNVLSVRERA